MPVLENGDVIPSWLKPRPTQQAWDGGVFDEVKLLKGEVKDVIYPDDKRSRTKRTTEYVVFAQKASNGFRVSQEYRCVASTLFGGVADKFHYTLRTDSTDNRMKEAIGDGSKVIFMCINGEKHRGIILTGVRDDNDDADTSAKDKGHHMLATFNGVTANVDKDGQFFLTHNGATDRKGKGSDKETRGTKVSIDKNDVLTIAVGLNTKDSTSGSITMDPGNRTIDITASKNVSIESRQAKTQILSHDDLIIQSTDDAVRITGRFGVVLKAKEGLARVTLGTGTDKMLLGSSHIDDLRTLCQTMIAQLTVLGTALSLPPFPKPAAQTPVTQMVQAWTQFMGKLQKHLSQYNTLD